jgi:hypothetical protein
LHRVAAQFRKTLYVRHLTLLRNQSLAERNLTTEMTFLWKAKLQGAVTMGRSILLLLLGVPLPIILLLALVWH